MAAPIAKARTRGTRPRRADACAAARGSTCIYMGLLALHVSWKSYQGSYHFLGPRVRLPQPPLHRREIPYGLEEKEHEDPKELAVQQVEPHPVGIARAS